MSALLVIGLVFQAAALAIVFVVFGTRAFRLVGPAFVLIAVLFHGVTELIEVLGLAPNVYRALVAQEAVDEWVALVSVAILLVAVSYVLAADIPAGSLRQRAPTLTLLRWQVLLVVAAPMYVISLTGRASSQEDYWLGGLATQFLTLAFVFASFDFIRRHGGRYFVPALLVQSVLLAPVGSRWTVVAAAVLTVWALAFVGSPPTWRQGLVVLASALLAAAIISSARTAAATELTGHFTAVSGASPSLRAELMVRGVKELPTSWREELFWTDWVHRADGNSLPALVSESAEDLGGSPLGFERLLGIGLVAVPRAVFPTKLDLGEGALNEETAVVTHYSLPDEDYLSPTLGTVYAYTGPIGLLIGAILIGVAFALLDRWLVLRVTAARLIVGVGVMLCVLLYERGLQVYPITLRGIVTLLILAKAAELIFSSSGRLIPRAGQGGTARYGRPARGLADTRG